MYRLRTELDFSSAHLLKGYQGACSQLHGHNWRVELFVVGERLDDIGILVDFKVLRKHLSKLLKGKLDHKFLNDVVDFNPTAENLSRYIFFYLKKCFVNYPIKVDRVRVWENDKNYCEFFVKEEKEANHNEDY